MAQAPCICRIKLNPGKTHLIKLFRRNAVSDTSITMNLQLLKVTPLVKFLDVLIANYLSMKCPIEHIKRAFNLSIIVIVKLNSINATLLIRINKLLLQTILKQLQLH